MKDALGRTIKSVTPLYTTQFFYDPNGQQIQAKRGTQNRYYGYDARGFLLSERHLETGPNGNGTLTYTRDAFGQLRHQSQGNRDLTYLYDATSRLTWGTVTQAGSRWETYQYNTFDNITSVQKENLTPVPFTVNTANNRYLGDPQAQDMIYDSTGNLIQLGAPNWTMTWDAFDMQTNFTSVVAPESNHLYAYGPGDYRIITLDTNLNELTWHLRDTDGTILREYTARAITDGNGNVQGRHDYYPFGEETPRTGQVDEPMVKFTGHQRDAHGLSDYMLGRTCLWPLRRFASVDPARDGWNLYAYTQNNPILFTDPDGKEIVVQVHPVIGGRSHASIRIEPEDQSRAQSDPFVGRNFKTGKRYATLGAGPNSNNPVAVIAGSTELMSDVNRDRDFDLQSFPKTEEVVLDLGGRDEGEVIDALFAADANYDDNLPYELLPDGDGKSYNSNSYVSGLLTAVGFTPPPLTSNVPGYDQPVPSSEFIRDGEKGLQ